MASRGVRVVLVVIIWLIDSSRAWHPLHDIKGELKHDDVHMGADPVINFELDYPRNGSVVELPLRISFGIGVHSMESYTERYAKMQACVEIQDVEIKCNPILDADFVFDALESKEHTVRAFITDGVERDHTTKAVVFKVASRDEFVDYASQIVEEQRRKRHFPKDLDLLEWAQNHYAEDNDSQNSTHSWTDINTSDVVLVIGVKTAVLTNFPRRQAIRETWGHKTKQVLVVFLGCTPTMDNISSDDDRARIHKAIAAEKSSYGDMLTDELDCEDAYGQLADKVKAFLRFAAATFPQTPYVMTADDDIYLRVDKVADGLRQVGKRSRVYTGQAWNSIFTRTSRPVRNALHPNFLPSEQYPLDKLLPFAFGPHYILSMDCAQFIAKNHWRLRSLNGLEDVSVALWLLTMQVQLRNEPKFSRLSFQPCTDDLESIADLSPLGIRIAHENVRQGRSFCHGYDELLWMWCQPA